MTPTPPPGRWQRAARLAQRACFAALVFDSFWSRPLRADQPYPVGLARYVDFSFLADPAFLPALQIGVATALILYVIGVAMQLATGTLFFFWVGAGALYNSHGAIGHSTQLTALVLLAQFVAYTQTTIGQWGGKPSPASGRHQLAAWYTKQTIVATYMVAGVSKLVHSSGLWVLRAPNLSVQIVKTHDQTYYGILSAGLMERGDLIASTILAYPNATRLLLGGSLLLELGAVAALADRRISIGIGLALVAMHRGIGELMLLVFHEHEALVLIYLIELPILVVAVLRRLWIRRIQSQPR